MKPLFEDKLRIIASDEIMMQALREAVEERIKIPEINPTDDDAILGQKFRAAEAAKEIMNGVLVDISSHKGQQTNNKINKGK